jgi:hypothetical protein
MTVTSYSTEELVRQGLSKLGEKNISPEFINEAIKWASSDCDLFSGKTWTVGEQYYETIQGCAEMLAVCYSLAIQNDKDVRQMNQFNLAMARLNKIKEVLLNTGVITISGTLGMAAGIDFVPKQTYPMNYRGEEIYAARRKGIISVERDTTTEKFITGIDNSDFV